MLLVDFNRKNKQWGKGPLLLSLFLFKCLVGVVYQPPLSWSPDLSALPRLRLECGHWIMTPSTLSGIFTECKAFRFSYLLKLLNCSKSKGSKWCLPHCVGSGRLRLAPGHTAGERPTSRLQGRLSNSKSWVLYVKLLTLISLTLLNVSFNHVYSVVEYFMWKVHSEHTGFLDRRVGRMLSIGGTISSKKTPPSPPGKLRVFCQFVH